MTDSYVLSPLFCSLGGSQDCIIHRTVFLMEFCEEDRKGFLQGTAGFDLFHVIRLLTSRSQLFLFVIMLM